MAEGVFTIAEIADEGESFVWTAASTPAIGQQGGARACPEKPWMLGGSLTRKRTNYPGARLPTEQVMYAAKKDQELKGTWDDRYNFPGYALGEMRRFEAMCDRGNRVHYEYQTQQFDGLIVDWEFDYRTEWLIGYHVQISVHQRTDDAFTLARVVGTSSPGQAMDRVELAGAAALDAHARLPRVPAIAGLAQTIDAALRTVVDTMDEARATLELRDLRPELKPLDQFARLATQLRTVQQAAHDTLSALSAVRSDVSLGVQTVKHVLDFEDWSRSLRWQALQTLRGSQIMAREVQERATPQAARLYRPQRGESIYAIARRFYGSSGAWTYIAERNNLQTVSFNGDELLVIPQPGVQ